MMPAVKSSSEVYGDDQDHDFRAQGAHRGNCGRPAGGPVRADVRRAGVLVKNTYGTGCFLLMNSGEKADRLGEQPADDHRLEDRRQGRLRPRREHLRRRLGRTVVARRAGDHPLVVGNRRAGGVGARHQRRLLRARADGACGPVLGPVCAGRDKRHQPRHDGAYARAALEGIAYQTLDIVGAMQRDSGITLRELKVDGGAARNDLLMQFQSDLLDTRVTPQRDGDHGAGRGLPRRAGGRVLGQHRRHQTAVAGRAIFEPTTDRAHIAEAVEGWKDAVRRVLRS